MCYADATALFQAMASDCPVSTSEGYPVTCTAQSDGYTEVTHQSNLTSTTVSVKPTPVDCVIDVTAVTTVSWLIAGVFCAAFAINVIRRVAR